MVTALTSLIVVFGDIFGIGDLAKEAAALLAGSYIGSVAVADTNKVKRDETVGQQAMSKKFRFTLIGLALQVVSSIFGIDLGYALAILGGSYNLGQGYSDKFVTAPAPKPKPKTPEEVIAELQQQLMAERASKVMNVSEAQRLAEPQQPTRPKD